MLCEPPLLLAPRCIDDIVVFSDTLDKRLEYLETVRETL